LKGNLLCLKEKGENDIIASPVAHSPADRCTKIAKEKAKVISFSRFVLLFVFSFCNLPLTFLQVLRPGTPSPSIANLAMIYVKIGLDLCPFLGVGGADGRSGEGSGK
jgi:hypothetical protein